MGNGQNDAVVTLPSLTSNNGADVYIRNTKPNVQFDLTGWKHVRHVPASNNKWHKAKDHLAGTEVYGDNSNSSEEWSIKFDDVPFD